MVGGEHRPPPRASPRCSSASLTRTNARRSEPCSRAASAAPAPIESPWPSEPVEKSIPSQRVLGMACRAALPSPQYVSSCVARDAAGSVQRGVERERRVALREHEAVAVGIVRRRRGGHAEERREDLGDRERGADVADAGSMGLFEDRVAELGGVHERRILKDSKVRRCPGRSHARRSASSAWPSRRSFSGSLRAGVELDLFWDGTARLPVPLAPPRPRRSRDRRRHPRLALAAPLPAGDAPAAARGHPGAARRAALQRRSCRCGPARRRASSCCTRRRDTSRAEALGTAVVERLYDVLAAAPARAGPASPFLPEVGWLNRAAALAAALLGLRRDRRRRAWPATATGRCESSLAPLAALPVLTRAHTDAVADARSCTGSVRSTARGSRRRHSC